MGRHTVASADELADGDRKVVQVEGREIGIFNVEGTFYAYSNWCAHQSGPVCEGNITGTYEATFDRDTLEYELEWTDEGNVLNCPWHGWEYDIRDGECLSREKVQLPSYPVTVEDGEVIVEL
jgi:nitrite reductase/ring-hydroxylating ferredoxin subunit